MGERVLVLGGTGFIGANVVRALLHEQCEVTVLSRTGTAGPALAGVERRVRIVPGNLWDRASLARAMKEQRSVIHCAGHYPVGGLDLAGTLRRGVTEMRNVLATAREQHVRRVVYTSSLSTIGPPGEPGRDADERDAYVPGSVSSSYFEVKWAMEQEAYRAAAEGQDVVIVNPTIAIGPWDVKPTSGQLVLHVARGEWPVTLNGTLNFVHVRDVAKGHVRALEKGAAGTRYILGGENLRVAAFLDLVADEAGVPAPLFRVPYGPLRAASLMTEVVSRAGFEVGKRVRPVAPGLAKRVSRAPALPLEGVDIVRHGRAVDATKARDELGVPHSPVRDAVKDALAWFRETGRLPLHSTR